MMSLCSRGEQTTESVEKEMKKAEKVEVTSVNTVMNKFSSN